MSCPKCTIEQLANWTVEIEQACIEPCAVDDIIQSIQSIKLIIERNKDLYEL